MGGNKSKQTLADFVYESFIVQPPWNCRKIFGKVTRKFSKTYETSFKAHFHKNFTKFRKLFGECMLNFQQTVGEFYLKK